MPLTEQQMQEAVARNYEQFCTIPELKHVWQWAEEHRMLPAEVTPKSGMYDVSVTPWMKEPQESFYDPKVITTVLCMASRLGKTEGILNLIGQKIHVDPCNILMVYPTIDSAKKWAKEFLTPMFEHSRVFDGLVADPAKRDGESTMLSKRFYGGRLSGIGANSPSAFRQVQARLVLCDEIDAMDNTKEGDPITLAFKRADNYSDSIQVLSSTPTVKGKSRIWQWLEESDWRQWFVPSPHTGNLHVMDWANIVWPKGKPEKATYVDPDTGSEWTEAQRHESIMEGEWEATQGFKGNRGYQLNGIVSLFAPKKGYKSKYHQFASEFLDAKHAGHEQLQVWTNTFLAKAWEDPEVEAVAWEPIYDRRESYETQPLPERVLMLTIAADVQEDRIEYEWVGWLDDFESYGLKYGVIIGDTKQKIVWDKFYEECRREWKHSAGGSLRLARGFVDEGYLPEKVRKFCLSLLSMGIEVYPCKGVGRAGSSEPELVAFNPQKRQAGIRAPTWNVGANRAKRTIYMHLNAEPGTAHTMRWTDEAGTGYDERYFEMLTAERIKKKYHNGREYLVFEKPNAATRNEALDIRCYGYAAAVSLNPSWDGLRKRIAQQASVERDMEIKNEEAKKEVEKPKNKRVVKKATRRRGGGFVNGWK